MFGSLVEHFIFNTQNGGSVMKKMMGGASVMPESSGNGFILFLITLIVL